LADTDQDPGVKIALYFEKKMRENILNNDIFIHTNFFTFLLRRRTPPCASASK
jgi:hypothetical protein